VLDANALLAYFGQRPAAPRVNALLKEARRASQPLLMSVVNWGEVVNTTWVQSGESRARQLPTVIAGLPIVLSAVSAGDAFEAARLKAVYKLPYADSFAAALALRERATLVTSDPDFERLGKQVPILWLR
jgi:predicted nucleic acid-binding protein